MMQSCTVSLQVDTCGVMVVNKQYKQVNSCQNVTRTQHRKEISGGLPMGNH